MSTYMGSIHTLGSPYKIRKLHFTLMMSMNFSVSFNTIKHSHSTVYVLDLGNVQYTFVIFIDLSQSLKFVLDVLL